MAGMAWLRNWCLSWGKVCWIQVNTLVTQMSCALFTPCPTVMLPPSATTTTGSPARPTRLSAFGKLFYLPNCKV